MWDWLFVFVVWFVPCLGEAGDVGSFDGDFTGDACCACLFPFGNAAVWGNRDLVVYPNWVVFGRYGWNCVLYSAA